MAGRKLRDLGTDDLTWEDLWYFALYAPNTSQISLEVNGEQSQWTLTDHLLAVVADILNDANWQRGGAKGIRPERIKRPGTETGQTLGSDPIPISEFEDWYYGNGE